jgi:hypothetical protein
MVEAFRLCDLAPGDDMMTFTSVRHRYSQQRRYAGQKLSRDNAFLHLENYEANKVAC